ncbi:putative bifunctional diguanylate cyclase/phosphodiesterase [Acidihalobacter prosperus]|uniref:cyclic-guanylate-specific phosphodiesterase n=1 Tax=Acidihalobacter prosperus TaxID=160660 RepID=A0A1A6C1P4_9GAMM|nr:EAL domain-containing protein [Acidihalobacter prosperus]OBS08478.1 GGDEF domain-containing protein [Acidihalobacter prosperus]
MHPRKRRERRISVIASLILVTLTLVASLSIFLVMEHQAERIVNRSLQLSLESRVRLFNAKIQQRLEASQLVATRPFIIAQLKQLDADPHDAAAIKAVQLAADTLLPTGFSLIRFSLPDRHTIAAAGIAAVHPGLSVPLKLETTAQLLWSDGGFVLAQERPMLDGRHRLVGYVLTESRLPELTHMLRDTEALGRTGELVVCGNASSGMQCFPAALSRRIYRDVPPVQNGQPLPMAYAFEGKSGLVTTRDYRGHEVVAAYTPLAQLGLGMVLKVDTDELYAPIYEQVREVSYMLLFFLAAGLLLLYWLVNPLVRKLAISEREARHASERLRDSETRTRTILDNIDEGLVTLAANGTVESLNPMAEQLFGYAPGALLGSNMLDLIDADDHAKYRERIEHFTARQDLHAPPTAFELAIAHRNGKRLPTEVRISDMVLGGQQKFILAIQDITRRKEAEARILHIASHDPLTGLPNRTLLEDRIKQAIQSHYRRHERFAVIYIDLNDFKTINDSLGHTIGDSLLRAVSGRLKECLRQEDTVARQGGDEFIVILSRVEHPDDAATAVQKIIQTLTLPYFIEGHELHSGASLGIAIYPEDGHNVTALLKNSDTAMYQAKALGRNNYRFYSPEMDAKAADRLMLENNLRRALERNELALHYQPIVSLASGEVVAVEALLRWTHPVMGAVSPARFIPVAEDSSLILPIGEWVLETACRQIREWDRSGSFHGRIVINLSPRQFRQGDLVQRFTHIIKRTGIDPRRLGMEITESVIMENLDSSIRMLQSLKDMGVEFSLDDFGTGYSSLSYLKRFPVDKLKIDQSFVRDLVNDHDDESLVKAIIAMAHNLKIRVVAEGVETVDQLEFLREHRCDLYQGYYFSRPLPAHELKFPQYLPRPNEPNAGSSL